MPIPLAGRAQRPSTTRTLVTGQDGSVVRRTVLPGGVRVLSEFVPGVRSVAFGIWVGVGSRDETPATAGASHYLEHLLFKGTRRRDAMAIAAALDEVGGEMNAFTTKEATCYYARVLDSDLPVAVDVVTDMVTSSVIAASDVDTEREVILDEIAMHDDDPADAVHDAFAAAAWPTAPIGRPVLGTVESIEGMSRSAIAGYYRRRYRPPALVFTAAGNVDHAALLRLVRRALAEASIDELDAGPVPPRAGGRPPRFVPTTVVLDRPTEQANLVFGVEAFDRRDPRRFALDVLSAAVGGGMSSRLFQEVRERRGLAYSVYSFTTHFADTGMFGVQAGCAPNKTSALLDVCRTELAAVADGKLTADELERGKGQVRGGFVLGLEDTGSRMSRLGKAEIAYGELLTVDEVIAAIDAVTLDDVNDLAAALFGRPQALTVIGPYDDKAQFLGSVA